MELSNLKPAEGSVKKNKRVGRGQGSGRGGTSTRGHKGAKSRSGFKNKPAFEGGQMPIQRRLPKFGFKNVNRKEYTSLNLDKLQDLVEKYNWSKVDVETLRGAGIISKTELVKVLARGEVKAKVELEVHAISAAAKEAIEKQGGSVKLV